MTIQDIAPFISSAITIVGAGAIVWGWSSAMSKIKNDIASCNVSTTNSLAMQKKDIDSLLRSRDNIVDKLEKHEERLSQSDILYAQLVAKMEAIMDIVERIEKKLDR